MLQMILASKFFKFAKKHWEGFLGALAIIATFIAKRFYDNSIRSETKKEIETEAVKSQLKAEQNLSTLTEQVLLDSTPLPDTWDGVKQLSKKARPSKSAKAARDRILKKLQRKK